MSVMDGMHTQKNRANAFLPHILVDLAILKMIDVVT